MYLLTIASKLLQAWLVYKIVTTIYSVYLGPLSKIPGPKLAAFTRFILIYHRARGTSESWLSELHDKYGDVVRSAPNDISFATSRAWKDVYGYAPASKLAKNAKDPTYYAEYGKGISMVTADDSTHVRQRKLFSHAFSDKAIREQESIIQQNITQLISNLSKTAEASTKTDIVQDYNFASFDIMGDLAWGEPLGCLRNSAYTPWVSMIFSSVKLLALFAEVRSIPIFRSKTTMRLIIKSLPKSVTEKAGKHMKQAEDRVDARIANGNSRPDIWGKVLAIDDEEERGQKLHIDEVHANAQLFMVAGTETIATLLSGLTYYLLQNSEVMKILTKEIRDTFTSGSDITIASMSELTYLDACVNEALRIYPPVPAGLPRCVARGGATICGYNLPEMTTISVHQYATYHNPRNFHLPNDFHPDRWLENSTTNPKSQFYHDDRSAVQPFSVGPRNCLGINLAQVEIRLIITRVLYHFDMKLCGESQGWENQRVFTLWEKGPLMVTLEKIS